jgi:glycosyltransferase involved in cell wall biosynthesis
MDRSAGGLDIGVYGARAIPSTYSGFETFLSSLLPALAARGHSVTMYCRRGVDGAEASVHEGVRRVVLPALSGKQFSTLSHGALATVVARRNRHDVLLVVNPANGFFCWLNRLTGQPVVLNVDGQEWLRGKWGWVARKVFWTASWLAGRSATGLVADCRAMREVFLDEFGSPSTVVPYCAPPLDWEAGEPLPDELGLHDEPYVVTGGRLNPENNIDGIAASFSRTQLDCRLVVLGTANYDSPVQRRLDELAARDPRIRLLGHVGDRHVFLSLLHHARAYVHGHSVGGMNPSLVEAMRAGALIVALDTPFNREVLGDSGSFFPGGIGRVGDLAAPLSRALSLDAADAAATRARARQRAEDQFALAHVVDGYESLLLAASAAGRSRSVQVPTRWDADRAEAATDGRPSASDRR